MQCLIFMSYKRPFSTHNVKTHVDWVAAFPADGDLAGRAVVAIVASALERLVDAAAELAV